MNKKMKYILILILVMSALLLVSFAVSPLFNTGLTVETNIDGAKIIVEAKDVSQGEFLKLKPGNYKVTVFKKGYMHKEKNVSVSIYGKTTTNIDLDVKTKPLISGMPIYSMGDSYFSINGGYNNYEEPAYFISYYDHNNLEAAKNNLKQRGINSSNSIINFSLDGD